MHRIKRSAEKANIHRSFLNPVSLQFHSPLCKRLLCAALAFDMSAGAKGFSRQDYAQKSDPAALARLTDVYPTTGQLSRR